MPEPLQKNDLLEATCPDCAGVLTIRVNARLKNAFVGCTGFPRCTFTREVKDTDRKFDPDNHKSDPDELPPRVQVGDRIYNGCLCEECHKKQFDTPSGVTCENGHGGAGSINPDTGEITYPDEKMDWDGMAEAMQIVDSQEVVAEEEGVNLITVRLTYFKESGKYYSHGSFSVDFCDFYEILKRVVDMQRKLELPGLMEGSGADFYVLIETPDQDGTEAEGVPHLLTPTSHDDDLTCNQCGLEGAKDRRFNGVDVGQLCQVCWKGVITHAFNACSKKG